MIILGVDPGLLKTGWGVIEKKGPLLTFVACGVITTQKDDPLEKRLLTLHIGLAQIVTDYNPHEVAIEETFVNNNAATSLKLGHARGALLLTAAMSHKEVFSYAPRSIKKAVASQGTADKAQIAKMIMFLLPKAILKGYDSSDALAVSICHAHSKGYF